MANIRVMIVEDSPVVQSLLKEILESDDQILVTSVFCSAEEALEFLESDQIERSKKPDLITLDIQLAKMDGLEFTNHVMREFPIPIVVVSAVSEKSSVVKAFDLLKAGALAAIEKPVGLGHEDYQRLKSQLISTVKLMAEIKLVTRRDLKDLTKSKTKPSGQKSRSGAEHLVVAVGASTGGPTAIQQILKPLPEDFPVPIVIAQHIAEGFVDGFVSWLRNTTGYDVEVAADNQKLAAGKAYVCPDGYQTCVTAAGSLQVSNRQYFNGVRPSVSFLFDSVAKNFGKRSIGILLSGMGKDGAAELKLIKEKGGITVAQDKKTSIVHGMPGEAIRLGAADHIMNAESISRLLLELTTTKRRTL